MSERFTPGPWSYTGDSDGDFVVWGKAMESFVANAGAPFQEVGKHSIAFDANQADARLIAAAPEMYALLDDLESIFGDPNTSGSESECAYDVVIKWLILRARINGEVE